MYIDQPSSKYAQTNTNGEQLNNKTFKPKQMNKMYFRYVRTIQNQNPVQSSNSLPRKNKVKKASHEKKQVRIYSVQNFSAKYLNVCESLYQGLPCRAMCQNFVHSAADLDRSQIFTKLKKSTKNVLNTI